MVRKSIGVVQALEKSTEVAFFGEPYDGPLHVHHIFSVAQYPQLATHRENLIYLTLNQHLDMAHPKGSTHSVDPFLQLVCLQAKVDSIQRDYQREQSSYSWKSFCEVLNIGLDTDVFHEGINPARLKAMIVMVFSERVLKNTVPTQLLPRVSDTKGVASTAASKAVSTAVTTQQERK